MPGEQRMWVSKDSYTTDNDEVTLIKRVEDVVLVHLRDNGYPNGLYQAILCYRHSKIDVSEEQCLLGMNECFIKLIKRPVGFSYVTEPHFERCVYFCRHTW